ncbi:hypothetical protein ACQR16_32630 [Bradyrhizobium oligotrophicum]|uniref:hypothetical protein n=1 Tax=Bradyrhizobium oligotrophicum TaxID=44255 RepID=UPI003EC0C744
MGGEVQADAEDLSGAAEWREAREALDIWHRSALVERGCCRLDPFSALPDEVVRQAGKARVPLKEHPPRPAVAAACQPFMSVGFNRAKSHLVLPFGEAYGNGIDFASKIDFIAMIDFYW